jgi:hypothetical protein
VYQQFLYEFHIRRFIIAARPSLIEAFAFGEGYTNVSRAQNAGHPTASSAKMPNEADGKERIHGPTVCRRDTHVCWQFRASRMDVLRRATHSHL